MDGCMKGPQLEEGENLNTGALGAERTPLGGTFAPLDNRGQERVTPRKLYNEESRNRGRPQTARKHRKSVSRKKGTSKSHRSVRSEALSRSKSKSVKSKPQSVRASRRKSSSDLRYDTVSDSGSQDLSMPYRRPKPMPFTSRITRFRYHRRAKLPPNVRVYEGNKDPEDHLSISSAAAEQEEWPMPVYNEQAKKHGYTSRTKNMLTEKQAQVEKSRIDTGKKKSSSVTDKEPKQFGEDALPRPPEYSLAEDSLALVLQALRRSSSIFTSFYVAVQKLKKTLTRASVQIGWQCQAERC
ncbi:hypothetical protein Tco_0324954 [Tanacetum coccineum]